MKRLGLIILFICVIILSLFLRKRNVEEFLDTTGQVVLAITKTTLHTTADGISGLCFNKINNTLYFVNAKQGTVNSLSLTGEVNTIMDRNTSIVDNGTMKLTANSAEAISCDNNGNLYVTDRRNFRIYKIPYSSIQTTSCTPELFIVSDETPTKTRVARYIVFDSNNNMYVLWTNANSYRICKYDSNKVKTDMFTSNTLGSDNSGPSSIAIDSQNNIYWGQELFKLMRNGTLITSTIAYSSPFVFDSSGNYYWKNMDKIRVNTGTYTSNGIFDGDPRVTLCFDNSGNLYTSKCNLSFAGSGIEKLVLNFNCRADLSYSSTGKAPCTPCPGTTGRLTCTTTGVTCKTNYELNATTGTSCDLKACPAGTYHSTGFMPTNGSSCTSCPTGPGVLCDTYGTITCDSNHIQRSGTAGASIVCEPKPCVAGFYSLTGRQPCKACPTTNRSGPCLSNAVPTCATNYTLNPITGTSCDPAPCSAGTYNLTTGTHPDCIACPSNATCTSNSVTCSSNYTQTGSGTSITCSPTPCATGFYSSNGFAPCRSCPANSATCGTSGDPTCELNYRFNRIQNTCEQIPCSPGFYSSTGYAPCLTCPTNSICTSNSATCPTGSSLNSDSTQCLTNPIPCPIGSYSASGQTAPGSSNCTPCPTGYTTTATASTALSNCVKPLTPQDILTWLITNGYNIASPVENPTTLPANAKYYGLSLADFTNFPTTNVPTISSGAYSGTLETVESYLKPLIVTSSVTNLLNKNLPSAARFNYLTNSQGEAVGGKGVAIQYPTTSIQYSQGSEQKKKQNITSCISMTDPTSCTYKWNGTEGPITANPCPALNSWFDFDKEACVDALGNKVTTKNTCSDSGVYNLTTNACVPVRVPVKSMPPKTLGQPGSGDYKDCKTVDQGDCTLLYTLGSNVTTTNPCPSLRPNYDFKSRSCTGDACCSLTVQQAANNRECSKYVNAVNTPNAKCANPRTPLDKVCCKPENANKIQCQSYYSKTSIFNASYNNLCQPSGFEDYAQQFVLTGPSIPRYF